MKKTKTILIALTAAAVSMAVTLCVSCNQNEQQEPEQMVTINPPSVELALGGTYQLEVNVYPDAELASKAQWSSDNGAVATVDANGLVTAVSAGEVVITVDVDGTEATCDVTVLDVAVEAVLLEPNSLIIGKAPGRTEQLTAVILPTEASSLTLKWTSSDESVATVDESGIVTPVAAGETVITAEAGGKQATCAVTVEEIVISQAESELLRGMCLYMTAEVKAENPENIVVEWTTSDPSVAEVESYDREVYAYMIAAGETVVRATAGDMVTECRVKVSEYVIPDGVGDIIYSDGSRSAELDPGKTPVGVVFWVGDPTAYDTALKRDYPGCTHGLAVALDEVMSAYQDVGPYVLSQTFGGWIDSNPSDEYGPIVEPEWPYNIQGYNNTKAMRAYNANSSEAVEAPILPVQALEDYTLEHPLPEGASSWYIPSFQELILMGIGEVEDLNILEQEYSSMMNWTAVYLNTRLSLISSAQELKVEEYGNESWYWSSSEIYDNVMGLRNLARLNMARGAYGTDSNTMANKMRYVFAF